MEIVLPEASSEPLATESVFQQRQQQFAQAEQDAHQRHNQLAFWRLVWFVGAVVVVWILIQTDRQTEALLTVLVGAVGFLILLRKHQTIRRERDLQRQLLFINQDEAGRLERYYLRPETGEQFASATHFYSGDLDVFGRQSLFRLLNRTHTYLGQQRLASWLTKPAPPDAIRSRQQAVRDLLTQLDWRQQLEALTGLQETVSQSPDKLVEWAAAPADPLPAYLNIIRFLFPAITFGLFVAWLTGYVPGAVVLLALGVHGLLLSQTAAKAKAVSEQTSTISLALRAYQELLKQAEQVTGDSIRLRTIRQQLTQEGVSAASAVAQLADLTEGLNYRLNPYFYLLFGVASLWDIQYLHRLEGWRNKHGQHLRQWFDALAELEALNSLAGFAYAHPDYTTPDIVDDEFVLELTNAVHPLLVPGKGIANSLELHGPGNTILITGSNMSGKSTFLRTVGANAVLALAGAVVSADQFWCSPVLVFTSMRTQDSLEESTSSFYAELKRLQTLINQTQKQDSLPVLYFLDEILKGTNSADRHRGAEALIRQLHHTNASGFVSTHDLELGQLTDADSFVRNYHFQSDLHDEKLVFDYQLRSGICRSFNASQLMQAIGIQMNRV